MTDDERARVIAELRWLADARKEYETDTFPQIAREVQTARQLADILERKTPVSDGGQGFGWIPSWRWNEWDDMAAHDAEEPEWEYVRRRVSKFETVTADMVPVKQEEGR